MKMRTIWLIEQRKAGRGKFWIRPRAPLRSERAAKTECALLRHDHPEMEYRPVGFIEDGLRVKSGPGAA
jgi:hypothetical protein